MINKLIYIFGISFILLIGLLISYKVSNTQHMQDAQQVNKDIVTVCTAYMQGNNKVSICD